MTVQAVVRGGGGFILSHLTQEIIEHLEECNHYQDSE